MLPSSRSLCHGQTTGAVWRNTAELELVGLLIRVRRRSVIVAVPTTWQSAGASLRGRSRRRLDEWTIAQSQREATIKLRTSSNAHRLPNSMVAHCRKTRQSVELYVQI